MPDYQLKRHYGLIGFPLSHSFSENYFTEKFKREGILDCEYKNYSLANIAEFNGLKSDARQLSGLNVTIPYKEAIIPYLDEIDPEAGLIGAVNCIRINNGKYEGFNTDAYGFEMSIKPFLENKYERAIVLGTGGGSRAVAHVLRKWGIDFHFVSRSKQISGTILYEDLREESMQHFKLIINTTPCGMFPDTNSAPKIPYRAIGSEHFLYDLIYNPSETTFLRNGRERGAHTMNGSKMLQLQAERSWEIWNR